MRDWCPSPVKWLFIRFESGPDYEEMIIFLYGIRSIKPENLSDSLERRAICTSGGMVDTVVLEATAARCESSSLSLCTNGVVPLRKEYK